MVKSITQIYIIVNSSSAEYLANAGKLTSFGIYEAIPTVETSIGLLETHARSRDITIRHEVETSL